MNQSTGSRFSLIEVLVVLSVIAILISILLPIIKSAKTNAFRIQCSGNLKQLGELSRIYSMDNNDHLPSFNLFDYYWPQKSSSGVSLYAHNTRGWQGHLAPYLFQKEDNNWKEGNPWMKEIANSDWVPYTYIVRFPQEGWGPFKTFICPTASNQDRVGTPWMGIPYSYMAPTTFCGENGNTSLSHTEKTSAKYSEIENLDSKVLLWEGASRIGVPNGSSNYNSVMSWKPNMAASTSPLYLGWTSSQPEHYGKVEDDTRPSNKRSNQHGNMHFLHDDDNSGQEGYQNNLFLDGHVERCHEWWLYLSSPIIFSKKGSGLRPRNNGSFDSETYDLVSTFF